MESFSRNRVSGFLDSIGGSRTNRSEEQRRASRLNGSKSKGPATSEGKAISRYNATQHGLTGILAAPRCTGRRRQLAVKLRRDLLSEFCPGAASERLTVECVADDYMRLARAREMIAALAEPRSPLSEEEEGEVERLRQIQRGLRLEKRLLAQAEPPQTPLFTTREAADLARTLSGRLNDIVKQLDREKAEAAEEDAPELGLASKTQGSNEPPAGTTVPEAKGAPLRAVTAAADVAEQEEAAQDRRLLERLGSTVESFGNWENLHPLLDGARRPTKRQWSQLRALAEHGLAYREGLVRSGRELELRVERHREKALGILAASPDKLLLLERYVREIEGMIRRKLRALRGR